MNKTSILVTLISAFMPTVAIADTKDEALLQSFFKDH